MIQRMSSGAAGLPPLEKGRSASAASRVGISGSRFDLTKVKTARARQLRRNSTDVEMRLWQKLRNRQLGVDFRRQHPAGSYVLDFYAPAIRLAVELDGGQHAQGVAIADDRCRTRWLEERGVTVLRFWNSDVLQNLSGVLEVVAANVAKLQASGMTPTRRWRADLPLSGGGNERRGPQ
jgi:very-short-patch-repair endonuclease